MSIIAHRGKFASLIGRAKDRRSETPKVHTRELTRQIKVVDIKGYLQKEYERAEEREEKIAELEKTIEDLEKIKFEYDAMLVVQEKTQERTERLDAEIERLRDKLKAAKETEKLLRSQSLDLMVNAEKKLKEKTAEIRALKKELKSFKEGKK